MSERIPMDKIFDFGMHCALVALAAYTLYKCGWENTLTKQEKIEIMRQNIEKSQKERDEFTEQLRVEKSHWIRNQYFCLEVRYVPFLAVKDSAKISRDPFMPPFEKGKYICDLPPYHRLIYNKYYFCRNHLLLVTKIFENQTCELHETDWEQILLLIEAVEGLAFYNCGENACYSQKHKHIQILPCEGLRYPLISKLIQSATLSQLTQTQDHSIFLFKGFDFLHAIYRVKEEKNPKQYLRGYQKLMRFLQIKMKGPFDYSLVACNELILVVPRKYAGIYNERVWLNSSVFLGFVMVDHEEYYSDFLKKYDSPEKILNEITFPNSI